MYSRDRAQNVLEAGSKHEQAGLAGHVQHSGRAKD